jgi:choline dehydrogenase-like flavoprotein
VISTVTVEARAVCCSASATGTAALLQRSRVPDPQRLIGSRLHLHPGAAVAGIFQETLRSWIGIPQSYECTEFLDLRPGAEHRIWIVPAFAHPAGVSASLATFGAEHARYLSQYPQMAALSPMIHDHTAGTVSARGRFGVRMEYWPDAGDRAQLRRGLQECARLLLAAGAQKVLVSLRGPVELTRPDEVDPVLGAIEVRRHELDLTAVHPMATVWMGDDPATSCVDSTGRYHHLDNVFVADTSLFPTSTGGPPQLTTYALGVHVGRSITRLLG